MKKTKKQRRSETLVKFHKGILKLSIKEKDWLIGTISTVGKRKNNVYITSKSNIARRIFWAVDNKLNYRVYNWVHSQNRKSHELKWAMEQF